MPITGLRRDLVSGLRRHRAANLVVVATLAVLGAAAAAILSLAYNVFVAPFDYPVDRLVVVRHGIQGATAVSYGFAADEYRAVAASGRFEAVSASRGRQVAYGDGRDAARPITLVETTPNALAVTGAQPRLGRFVESTDVGRPNVVISHDFWTAELAQADDVLGRSILLDDVPHTVVGVMPPRFHFIGGDLWTAHRASLESTSAVERLYVLNGLLREGDSVPVAGEPFDLPIEMRDASRYPDGWRVEVLRVIDAVMGADRLAVTLLVSGVLMLAAIGLANLAMVVVTRQLADTGPTATRLALGERRSRLVAVAFVESLVLCTLGVLAASALGAPLFHVLVSLLSFEWIPRELEGHFTYANPMWSHGPLAVLLLAAAMTALRAPMLASIEPRGALEGSSRTSVGRAHLSRLRWLTGTQAALATAVLILAAAISTGLSAMDDAELGFNPGDLMHARLVFPASRYPSQAERTALLDRLSDAHAGAVGYIDAAPMQRNGRSALLAQADGRDASIDYRAVHGEIGAALGIASIEGRPFAGTRDDATREPVMWVNRALARQLAGNGSALDLSATVRVGPGPAVARRIVGVVDDVRHDNALTPPRPTAYVPFAQESLALPAPIGVMAAVLRSVDGTPVDAAAIGRWAASVEPWIALRDIESFDARGARSVAGVTIARRVFALFSVLALGVAAIGMAAAASLTITSRRRELAVRCALGRSPKRLWLDAVRSAGTTSVVAGLVGAIAVSVFFRLRPALLPTAVELDFGTGFVVVVVIVTAAMLSTAWPARRVLATDATALVRT